jgi:hypothetical protein
MSATAQRRRAQRCSERHMSGEAVDEEERGCFTVGCSLYSRQRRWNKGGAAVEPWAANSGGGHGGDVVGAVWAPTSGQ